MKTRNILTVKDAEPHSYEIGGEQVSKELFDRLSALESFQGKIVKGINKRVSYVSNDTSSTPRDAVKCALDDNIDNKERCYIIPSTLNGDEIECLRLSGTNEIISSIYPNSAFMGKNIALVEIDNEKKTLIDIDSLEEVKMKVPGTNCIITNIDIVTNKYSPIQIAGKEYSRVKFDNGNFFFLDSIDLNPITYNGTNDFMRHDNFRKIILGGNKVIILKKDNSTIFLDPQTGSKVEMKIQGTNDKITDLEFYMYRVKGIESFVFKAKINGEKRVVIDQENKITHIDPNSLEGGPQQELSIKDRIKSLES